MLRLWIPMLLVVAACGESEVSGDTVTLGQPLDLASIDRGVSVHSGEPMALASYQAATFGRLTTALPHAVLHVQAYDAATQELGEYVTFPAPNGVDSRGPVVFKSTAVASGRFENRVDDLVEEIDTFGEQAGAAAFASTSVVFDFWRLRQDWAVRWDGKLEDAANRQGRGQYGFFRRDFSEELLDQIENTARTHQPRYFIVGTEVERLLATSDGAGIAPHEFANFFAFYQEAATRIRTVSPNTKVGFGIDWDRFYTRVSGLYAPDDVSRDEAVDAALVTTLVPLWRDSDVVALSLYQPPGADAAPYAYLKDLSDKFEIDLPIVYHSVGSPVDSSVDYLDQKNFLDEFAQRNDGLNVEFMAWRRILNFEGTDTANQQVAGRCLALTEASRGIEMPVTGCYDGLFTSVFSAKEVFTTLEGL